MRSTYIESVADGGNIEVFYPQYQTHENCIHFITITQYLSLTQPPIRNLFFNKDDELRWQ